MSEFLIDLHKQPLLFSFNEPEFSSNEVIDKISAVSSATEKQLLLLASVGDADKRQQLIDLLIGSITALFLIHFNRGCFDSLVSREEEEEVPSPTINILTSSSSACFPLS